MYIPVQIHKAYTYCTSRSLVNECIMPNLWHFIRFFHSSCLVFSYIGDLHAAHRGTVSSRFATLNTKRIRLSLKLKDEWLVMEVNNQPITTRVNFPNHQPMQFLQGPLTVVAGRRSHLREFINQPNYQSELFKPSTYLSHAVSSRTLILQLLPVPPKGVP